MDNNNLMEWALFYAKNGLAVFPLQPKSKKPFERSHGCKDATTDIETIKKWWAKAKNANIGIATGQSNLVVIDIDTHNDKDGFEVLHDWQKENGEFPETWQSLTGGGGSHLLFKTDKEISNTVNLFDGGIDVRSKGGYIVAPPSIHESGKRYEWECEHDPEEVSLASANDLVYRFINEGKKRKGHQLEWDAEISRDGIEKHGLIFSKGGRNTAIFQKACDCIKMGFNKGVTLASVQAFNQSQCEPPLNDKEVEATVNSAFKNKTEKGEIPTQITDSDLELKTIDDYEEKEAEWLIPDYIPKGQISIIAGDGGIGKSSIWCSLVASLSSGRSSIFKPDSISDQKKIMVLSGEDSISYTIKRRLRKNGAKNKNITCIDASDKRFPKLKLNEELLEKLVAKYKPDLLILDPIQSFLNEKINMSFRNAIRGSLQPLIRFGSQYGTTTLLVVHTNKRDSAYGRNRMADSADMWDAARSVLLIGKTKDNNIRYISHEKSNYSKEAETVLFSIEDEVPIFQGYTDEKDRDFVTSLSYAKTENAKDDAKDFILEYLKDGKKTSGQIDAAGVLEGHSKRTIQRARGDLLKSKKIRKETASNGKNKGVSAYFSLPCPLSWNAGINV